MTSVSSSDNNGLPPKPTPSTNGTQFVKILTTASHVATPFISTFLLVHLAAPILANVGGTSTASSIMLLGREYYQTHFGEKYLVLGPIIIHSVSGISKRLLLKFSPPPSPLAPSSSPAPMFPEKRPQRPFKSILSLTAYTTTLFFLPIHYLTHRVYPSLPSPAISSVGPSSLDYEYVKFGIQTWPWKSWFLYGGLVTMVMLHAVDGAGIVWGTWITNREGKRGKRGLSRIMKRILFVGGMSAPVLLGVWSIAKEPRMLMSFLEERYRAAYEMSYIFRL